jgi:RNA polymerase sigma-70 factor (ECF subfamily)
MNIHARLLTESAGFAPLEVFALQDSTPLESAQLADFLATVERPAFRIAQIALRHDEDALDAVQDAMLRLVRRYAQRPAAQWRPLFYRILENCVRDMQRRRRTRNGVMAWLPWRGSGEDEPDAQDLMAQAPDPAPTPAAQVQTAETMQALERAVSQLPARQRQAFLLRSIEGMDVAAAAQAMSCSEGSVKTHYFRALQTLRVQLGEYWS